jgi:hypothetical protein
MKTYLNVDHYLYYVVLRQPEKSDATCTTFRYLLKKLKRMALWYLLQNQVRGIAHHN